MLEFSVPRRVEQLEKCLRCSCPRHARRLRDLTRTSHASCFDHSDAWGVGHACRCHARLRSAQSEFGACSKPSLGTIQPCVGTSQKTPVYNSLEKGKCCGGVLTSSPLSPSLYPAASRASASCVSPATSAAYTVATSSSFRKGFPDEEASPSYIPSPFNSLLPPGSSLLPLAPPYRFATLHAVLSPSIPPSSSSSASSSDSQDNLSATKGDIASSYFKVTSHGRQCLLKDLKVSPWTLPQPRGYLPSSGSKINLEESILNEFCSSRHREVVPWSLIPSGVLRPSTGREVELRSSTSTSPAWAQRSRSRLRKTRGRVREALVRALVGVMVLLLLSLTTATAYKLKPTTTVSRVTLAGRTAKLPCELPATVDRPTLILWYKDEATKPFYSFDARETSRGHHKVHENSRLGRRSRFTLETIPNFRARLGFLEVENITLADAGNYTCRVDFMTSQTLMSLLQLTVHEEIRSLEIFDAYETMISQVVGPYEIASRVVLSCRAYGGYPPPVVKWMSGNDVVERSWLQHQHSHQDAGIGIGSTPFVSANTDASLHHYHHHRQTEQGLTVVSSKLLLPSLTRADHERQLKCVASNTNLTHDRSRVVTIEMYLPPLEVEVEGVEVALRAGVEATLACRSAGSRPPAVLTWQIDGTSGITPLPPHSSLDQNTTTRRGRLLPTPDDNGRTVACTATNPKVSQYTISTTAVLRVHFAPEVHVRLAPALDPKNIEEGDDVYFECQISANPPESRILWLHQGQRLHTDREQGVLAQGRNLVLQKVRREHRGNYQCVVTNSVDTVTSTPTALDVMFVPECREPRNVTVSVTANEEVTLDCVVESNPEEVQFLWKVNSSRGVKDLPPGSFTTRGTTSTLVYRPHAHTHAHDQYGIIFCLSRNRLGSQRAPCVFFITPAGPPEEPSSCSMVNQSVTSLAISCTPGHDGGLKQHFVTTVRDAATQEVVANVSSAKPTFVVGGLAPGRDYLLLVTAVNLKGSSTPYVIQDFALKVAENKINDSSSTESSPLLAVFVGVVSGFVFILTVLAVATRSRCRRQRGDLDEGVDNNKLRVEDEVPPSPSTKASLDEAEDADDELNTPESRDGSLETQELCAQVSSSPTTPGSSSRTYIPSRAHPQPLQSDNLPRINTNNHKYYKIKIDCTRLSNESFV